MTPVDRLVFKLDSFYDLKNELDIFPRGDLMSISINPFTGNVYIRSQNSANCDKLLKAIFQQLEEEKRRREVKLIEINQLKLFQYSEVA